MNAFNTMKQKCISDEETISYLLMVLLYFRTILENISVINKSIFMPDFLWVKNSVIKLIWNYGNTAFTFIFLLRSAYVTKPWFTRRVGLSAFPSALLSLECAFLTRWFLRDMTNELTNIGEGWERSGESGLRSRHKLLNSEGEGLGRRLIQWVPKTSCGLQANSWFLNGFKTISLPVNLNVM